LGLYEYDEVFVALERACDERSPWLLFLTSLPIFDPIRTDSRVERLRSRVEAGHQA
jgi:hypothetical protein